MARFDRDIAGFVERIGPNRWRLIMPKPAVRIPDRRDGIGALNRGNDDEVASRPRRIAAITVPAPANAARLPDEIRADMPQLMALYRDLHANPELSMQEVRTPAKLAPEMRKLGFDVTEHVGKTGVVAVMKNGPGPVLLIRADMDALPVKEQTGLPFASTAMGKLPDGTETPVMHACGHDTHITTWLDTGARLAAMKSQWSGTVVMVLQPGEERVMGAQGDARRWLVHALP